MRIFCILGILVAALNVSAQTSAQANPAEPSLTELSSRIQQLEQQQQHAQEIQDQRTESVVVGGNAILFFYREDLSNDLPRVDVLRVSPTLTFKPADDYTFYTRLSFTSGGSENHSGGDTQIGSSQVDQAYLDSRLSDSLKIRLGHQFLPLGLHNPIQQPTAYFSVSPPELETRLIPTPWHENGVQLIGDTHHFMYQVGLFNSLDAEKFNSNTFIRDGRQNGQNAKFRDVAATLRLDYTSESLIAGASGFYGQSSQGTVVLKSTPIILWDAHLDFQWRQFRLKSVFAEGRNPNAEALSLGPHAELARGYYLTTSMDVFGFGDERESKLPMFARFSQFNLHEKVPEAFSPDLNLKMSILTIGISYLPNDSVIFKFSHQTRKNGRNEKEIVYEMGAGVVF